MNLYAQPQRLVRIGRRRKLNVNLSGSGSPTVILSAGAGCSTLHWGRVQGPLARTNRVLAFDRAGMGFSDPGPAPRTTSRVVSDLRAALVALDIGPPYVLVGHSMGSFDVRHFAFLHPDEVVGMVLVDPRGNRHQERSNAAAPSLGLIQRREAGELRRKPAMARSKPAPGTAEYDALVAQRDPTLTDEVNDALRDLALRPSYWRTIKAEGDAANAASAEELRAAERQLDIPLIVLSALWAPIPGIPADEMRALNAAWRASHDELAALSPLGLRRDAPDGVGHMIQLQRPDIVIDAVREVIRTAAGQASVRPEPG
jgi:pimeloyl-ACP methyl ester carboxylesterase